MLLNKKKRGKKKEKEIRINNKYMEVNDEKN